MSDNQTLEAAPSVANEPSAPVAEVNQTTEQGEDKAAQTEATEDGAKEGENKKDEAPISEAEKIRLAMQKRIDRQTAASKALQERIRQLETEREQLSVHAPKVDEAPKQDDFDDYDAWEKATIEYHAKQKANEILKAEKEKELKVAQERQAAEARRQFEQKETAFRATAADYDRVASEAVETMNALANTGVDITGVRDMVMQFDNPPKIIYELGKDTALIEELVSMPPLKAMRELIKLEIALETNPKQEPKPLPEPIKPINPNGRARKRLDEMTYEEREQFYSKK